MTGKTLSKKYRFLFFYMTLPDRILLWSSQVFGIAFMLLFSLETYSQSGFEGVIKMQVKFAGVDLGSIAENIDYNKGEIAQQLDSLYHLLPEEEVQKLENLAKNDPYMTLNIILTPHRTSIYIKDQLISIRSKGLGYESQSIQDLQSDEGYTYIASLINPDEAVSATFKLSNASEIYPMTSADDSAPETYNIAGYDCIATTFVPEPLTEDESSAFEMHPFRPLKLVAYSSAKLPDGIIPEVVNYVYPHHLPGNHAIMRMDIYLHDPDLPTIIWEVVSIEKRAIDPKELDIKKTTPLYEATDPEYGKKYMSIIMDFL